jgi:hypothetical protein
MTPAQFRAQILGHVDNVSPTDAAYADRETRVNEWVVETSNDLWVRRAWPWRRTTAALTVTAALAYKELPLTFGALGHSGGVYLASSGTQGDRLDPVTEQELMEMRKAPEGATSTPDVYSIFGYTDVGDGTSQQRLQLPPLAGNVDVLVDYESQAPADITAALTVWPAQYHQSVFIPFVRGKALDSKGDGRGDKWTQTAERAYRAMAINERRRKESPRGLRSFFGGIR